MNVGDVQVWLTPFGVKDVWGDTMASSHKLAIRKAEKILGGEFEVQLGEGHVKVIRRK